MSIRKLIARANLAITQKRSGNTAHLCSTNYYIMLNYHLRSVGTMSPLYLYLNALKPSYACIRCMRVSIHISFYFCTHRFIFVRSLFESALTHCVHALLPNARKPNCENYGHWKDVLANLQLVLYYNLTASQYPACLPNLPGAGKFN